MTIEFAKVHRAGSLSVPHNTNTVVPFTTASHDPEGYWDSSSKLIVPAGKGGTFAMMGNTFNPTTQPNPDGNFTFLINGSGPPDGAITYIRNSEQAGGFGLGWLAIPVTVQELADGDEVELLLWQDSGLGGSGAITFTLTTLTLVRLG